MFRYRWNARIRNLGLALSLLAASLPSLALGARDAISQRVEALGFQYLSPSSIRDSKTGARTQFWIDLRNSARDVRFLSGDGTLTGLLIERPGFQIREETIRGRRHRSLLFMEEGDGLSVRVYHSELKTTRWEPTGETLLGTEAFMLEASSVDGPSCNPPLPFEELDALLSELARPVVDLHSGIQSEEHSDDASAVPMQNIRIRNCDQRPLVYPSNGIDPPGVASLISDAQLAWDQGFRCLDNLSDPFLGDLDPLSRERAERWRRIMAEVLGNFFPGSPRSFTLVCSSEEGFPKRSGFLAFAMLPAYDRILNRFSDTKGAAPGILVDVGAFARIDPHQRRSVLFHELLHHASGLAHPTDNAYGTRFDWVESATKCCFGKTAGTERAESPLSMDPKKRDRFVPRGLDCDRLFEFDHGEKIR